MGCPKWVLEVWTRAQLWHVGRQLEAERREQEALLIDRWLALEEMDSQTYDALGVLSMASKRVMRQLRIRRDMLTAQLERLSK